VLAALVIAGVSILTLGSLIKRLMDLNAMNPVLIPFMLLAAASPGYVAYAVLNPGPAVATAEVSGIDQSVKLDVPEDHSLMITATLAELTEEERKEPGGEKTVYYLNIQGQGWEDAADGTMQSESAGGGPDIDLAGGQGISESGRRRPGKWGEDIQDRADLKGSGPVEVSVTNWQGRAVEKLVLEVVPAPPPAAATWAVVVLVTLVGLFYEVRDNAERLSSDLAFLALWGVFLRDGVTPLDDFDQVAWAMAPAALLGWGAVAAVAYGAIRFFSPSPEPAEAPEPEPEPEEAQDQTTRRRRGGAAARRAAREAGQDDS
jgi:hypothetical protein